LGTFRDAEQSAPLPVSLRPVLRLV
jgi:hypothetical protein